MRSSSFEKPKKSSTRRNKPKSKLNIKQSSLAQYFSKKNRIEKNSAEIRESVLADHHKPVILKAESNSSTKPSDTKDSVQSSSRSYFKMGRHRNQPTGFVRGAEKFLKSRSKPPRTSVKISEVQPIGLQWIGGLGQGIVASKAFLISIVNFIPTQKEVYDQNQWFLKINGFKSNESR